MSFFASNRCTDSFAFKAIVEAVLSGDAWAFPIEPGDGVVGDEVDVGFEVESNTD